MEKIKQKFTLLLNGFIAIIFFLILIYLLVIVSSLGVMIVSGIYISLVILSQCLFGFLLFLVLKIFNILKTGLQDILLIITSNIIINLIFNNASKVIDRSDDKVTSVIIRHTSIEPSVIDFSSILVIVFGSLVLYGIFSKLIQNKGSVPF